MPSGNYYGFRNGRKDPPYTPREGTRYRTNEDCVEFWVKHDGKPGKGKTGNGNVWFSGPSLYSYETKVAHLVPGKAVLRTNENHSHSTQGHLRHLWGCKLPAFSVPYLDDDATSHRMNAEYLLSQYQDCVKAFVTSYRTLADQGSLWFDGTGEHTHGSIVDIDEVQTQAPVTRKTKKGYKTIALYTYPKREGVVVERYIAERLAHASEKLRDYVKTFALLEFKMPDVADDVAYVMALRRERERLHWHPVKVKARATAHAKKLLRALLADEN